MVLAACLALPRAHTVVKVCCRQDQCAYDRKAPVCRKSPVRMGESCTDSKNHHADDARSDDQCAAVVAIPQSQCNSAEWQNDDEHLRVQVALGELREKRQSGNEQRQREAMNQAQRR